MTRTICITFGAGGHRAQMIRLLKHLSKIDPEFRLIIMSDCPVGAEFCGHPVIHSTMLGELIDKDSWFKSLVRLLPNLVAQGLSSLYILSRFKVACYLTTGPGIGVLPAAIFRIAGIKVIAFESWSRFDHPSRTGKALHRIANVFFVQHQSMLKHYKNAIYKGRL